MNIFRLLVTPLALAAAFAVAMADPPPYRDTERRPAAETQPPVRFLSCADFRNVPVVDPKGRSIAKVNDLVIDTRWGYAPYAVIATGGLAGIGEHKAAVPLRALVWDARTRQFTLNMSDERLKALPAFDTEHLDSLDSNENRERLQQDFGEMMEDRRAFTHDSYTTQFNDRRTVTMTGKVLSVDRRPDASIGDTCTRLRLAVDGSQSERTVILGPSWYIARQSYMPKEGDQVEVTSAPTTRAGVDIASRVTSDESALVLRNDEGVPVWSGSTPLSPDELRTAIPRYILLKDFIGAPVRSGDEQPFGSINDAVIDRSGRVRFVIVSSGNAKGTAASKNGVPWDVIVRTEKILFAIEKDAADLKNAPTVKAPVDDLASSTLRRSIYSFYEIEPRATRQNSTQDALSDE
ncbi:MAG TPA: PRC-barrel domain-containing protein [Phycisphaerales bacterium]|nr:PRC-barrel domain-containing protein [Phycisphaerales bacterium]